MNLKEENWQENDIIKCVKINVHHSVLLGSLSKG